MGCGLDNSLLILNFPIFFYIVLSIEFTTIELVSGNTTLKHLGVKEHCVCNYLQMFQEILNR